MKFVKQLVTDYTSTEITETVSAWNSATTYAIGDEVIYGNYIWKNSYTSNLNNIPSDTSTKWVKYGVSNKYSLIDLRASTKTVVSTDATILIPRGLIDTLIIGNFIAESITIQNVLTDNTVLYEQTFTQSQSLDVYDYWTYIYSPYSLETNRAVYFNIPRLGDNLKIIITKGAVPQIEVGYMVGGYAIEMGKTLEGAKIGFTSFSTTSFDTFGIMSITKRAAQDLVDFETIIDSTRLMSITRTAKEYRDEVVGFIVDDSPTSIYENIVALGVMQDIQPIATNFDKTVITWSVLESV